MSRRVSLIVGREGGGRRDKDGHELQDVNQFGRLGGPVVKKIGTRKKKKREWVLNRALMGRSF